MLLLVLLGVGVLFLFPTQGVLNRPWVTATVPIPAVYPCARQLALGARNTKSYNGVVDLDLRQLNLTAVNF